MIRHSKIHRFRESRTRSRRDSAWSGYDPYWLEAENAYYRRWYRFPEHPVEPQVIEAPCREEFVMPVTVEDVRETLARVPAPFLRGLQAVFLLSGTRRQEKCAWGDGFSYGCYWEDCVFLHPFPRDMLRSVYRRSPRPSDLIEYARVGARITTETEGTVVRFNVDSLRQLYLRDVLIHEVGHHVDRANLGNEKENEAYARWFATEFGFRRAKGLLPQHDG